MSGNTLEDAKQKRQTVPGVKNLLTRVAILIALPASLTRADDFRTVGGKEYKNAAVSRVEPDGIVLRTKSGIVKLYFSELPKAVQERFRYDAAKTTAAASPYQTGCERGETVKIARRNREIGRTRVAAVRLQRAGG
jgi:hypothetical protein